MSELLELATLLNIVHLALRFASPYLYAAIGEMFTEKAGVLNLGVEGMMLLGAFAAFFVAKTTDSLWLGLLTGAAIGLLTALVMAFAVVTLQAVQAISGIGINMIGLGLSSLLFVSLMTIGESVSGFPPVKIPLLGDLPLVGPVFFNHSLVVYGAFLLPPAAHWVINRTPFGLNIRAVGENPTAADSLGVNVNRIRYLTLCLGGLLSGVAGATLSINLLNLFQENLTNGMGFIAVALVAFGGWAPWRILAGALLFSSLNALQLWIQITDVDIPSDVAAMLPYILTIVVLIFGARRGGRQPAALTVPFERGQH
jgi:simple sugar transport system permease protein